MASLNSTPANPLPELKPGDVLFYHPSGLFGKGITIKTWSEYSHTEMYDGSNPDKPIWGSRDPERWFPRPSGGGVNFYPFRKNELALIRRPTVPVNVEALRTFQRQTVGQKYDWTGLLKFFRISKGAQDKMFCSEAVTRALRLATGSQLFDDVDADAVSPGMLAWTPELTTIWRA